MDPAIYLALDASRVQVDDEVRDDVETVRLVGALKIILSTFFSANHTIYSHTTSRNCI